LVTQTESCAEESGAGEEIKESATLALHREKHDFWSGGAKPRRETEDPNSEPSHKLVQGNLESWKNQPVSGFSEQRKIKLQNRASAEEIEVHWARGPEQKMNCGNKSKI
jgi:hypothetical protein